MQKWLKTVAALGVIGVILGAFGAHGIKPKITPESYANYQTAVLYHFIHTLAILGVSQIQFESSKLKQYSLLFFLVGIVLFSGSLYLLATKDIHHMSGSYLGPITPIGGLCFIIGWALLLFVNSQSKKTVK
jgi:uncharacterized membrane protein YgdD (TMEM256/DUF423 family)